MRSVRLLVGAICLAAGLSPGCATFRHGPETCVLAVLVDKGRGTASPELIVALQQHIAPILAKHGLKLTTNRNQADLLAEIELTTSPSDPLHLKYFVRQIALNPYLYAKREVTYSDKMEAELRADLRRDVSAGP